VTPDFTGLNTKPRQDLEKKKNMRNNASKKTKKQEVVAGLDTHLVENCQVSSKVLTDFGSSQQNEESPEFPC